MNKDLYIIAYHDIVSMYQESCLHQIYYQIILLILKKGYIHKQQQTLNQNETIEHRE